MTIPRPQPDRRAHAGFTLVELMLVVVLMGIITVSVIPTMANVQAMRNGAARDDVARMLDVTRARAMAAGEPMGMRVNLTDSQLDMVEIGTTGTATPVSDPLTGEARSIDISAAYSGVSVIRMINGDGSSGSGTVWFDYEGTPHTRNNDGSFAALNEEQVEITLDSGERVLVYAYTGVVATP
ncbi:MAG: prepilin-type N-terminal cleavage/methylation domain-containing protein [Phycisphaerales bacterium JB052]